MTKTYLVFPDGEAFETDIPQHHKDGKIVSRKEFLKARRAYLAKKLREEISVGDSLYAVMTHRASSGMSRRYRIFIPVTMQGGSKGIRDISGMLAELQGYRWNDKEGSIVMGGCGYDAGFQIVYETGRVLFPEGFGVEGESKFGVKLRPLTKEKAEQAVKKGFKFRGRNGDTSGWDNDGGYALGRGRL